MTGSLYLVGALHGTLNYIPVLLETWSQPLDRAIVYGLALGLVLLFAQVLRRNKDKVSARARVVNVLQPPYLPVSQALVHCYCDTYTRTNFPPRERFGVFFYQPACLPVLYWLAIPHGIGFHLASKRHLLPALSASAVGWLGGI